MPILSMGCELSILHSCDPKIYCVDPVGDAKVPQLNEFHISFFSSNCSGKSSGPITSHHITKDREGKRLIETNITREEKVVSVLFTLDGQLVPSDDETVREASESEEGRST